MLTSVSLFTVSWRCFPCHGSLIWLVKHTLTSHYQLNQADPAKSTCLGSVYYCNVFRTRSWHHQFGALVVRTKGSAGTPCADACFRVWNHDNLHTKWLNSNYIGKCPSRKHYLLMSVTENWGEMVELRNRKYVISNLSWIQLHILFRVSVGRHHMAYFCVHSFANLLYFGLSVL